MGKQKTDEPKMSKANAIRACIAELGGPDAAKNDDVVEMVKAKYDLDTSTNEVSMYKSKLRKASGVPSKRGGKSDSSGVALAKEVKILVERFGADAVKGMADVFAD